jgi:hypothetical protein
MSGYQEDKVFGFTQSLSDGLLWPATDGGIGKEDGSTWASTLTRLIGSPVFN